MKAYIIVSGQEAKLTPFDLWISPSLMFAGDKPFLQHLIEYLIQQKVYQFEFFCHHLPEKYTSYFGDGTRWGASFTFNLLTEPAQPYQLIKAALEKQSEDCFLLACAEVLPAIELSNYQTQSEPLFFCWDSNNKTRWTGWSLISPHSFNQLPYKLKQQEFEQYILKSLTLEKIYLEQPPLRVQSFQDLLSTHQRLFHFPSLMHSVKEKTPGIWLSPEATIHHSVQLTPPVFIGKNCHIGKRVILGPNTFIGNNCVLDNDTIIENSVIFPENFVGKGLELKNMVLDRNCLVSILDHTPTFVKENFLIGDLSKKQIFPFFQALYSRFVATIFLLFFSPILALLSLILRLKEGFFFYHTPVVHLPASFEEPDWRIFNLYSYSPSLIPSSTQKFHFFLKFLPGLINVAKGDLHFVGLTPHSVEDLRKMPENYKMFYFQIKGGIITEAYLNFGESPTVEELCSAESYYATKSNIFYDMKLFLKYFFSLFLPH